MSKVVILLGAGATLSDVATNPLVHRPPLDKRFFAQARLTDEARVARIRRYMLRTYDIDVLSGNFDSLEQTMGQVYTDIFNPLLEVKALAAFRTLIALFNRRLASTTNDIRATNKRFIYRIVTKYLAAGVLPKDITIITFNQDIQVEKSLHLMSTVSRWKDHAESIFCFPGLYRLGVKNEHVTAPGGATDEDVFPVATPDDGCIALLKLHGSLNWYSAHSSTTPSRAAMFKSNRVIHVTRRREIEPDMTLSGRQRSMYTLPVIVPPVSHKSAVLHEDVRALWATSESRLRAADELVIFGYSCPPLDFESSNQLRRSQRAKTATRISVIDPEPAIATRYISVLGAKTLTYYASAKEFLRNG
jgi:hypothetical protein